MNRNVNLLLAVTSVLALFLVTTSAMLTATPDKRVIYLGAALFSCLGFMLLNRLYMTSRKRTPKPLVSEGSTGVLVVAMVFPLIIILSSIFPFVAPGADWGLMLIIAGIWAGLTLQSALAVLRPKA